MGLTLISCVDINNGIANGNGELLFNFPNDMKHFKSVTSGKIVVMGRKTWESLPKKPLEKRKNYVVTMDKHFNPVGAKTLHSIEEIIELGKKHDVYVIGGGEIYHQTIDYADRLLLTHVHVVDYSAKVHFPDYDVREWKLSKMQENEADEKHPHRYTFAEYKRK